jgi:hypothetical protein
MEIVFITLLLVGYERQTSILNLFKLSLGLCSIFFYALLINVSV